MEKNVYEKMIDDAIVRAVSEMLSEGEGGDKAFTKLCTLNVDDVVAAMFEIIVELQQGVNFNKLIAAAPDEVPYKGLAAIEAANLGNYRGLRELTGLRGRVLLVYLLGIILFLTRARAQLVLNLEMASGLAEGSADSL